MCGCGTLQGASVAKRDDSVGDVLMRDGPEARDLGRGDIRKEARVD
jgi:hypothetical protein